MRIKKKQQILELLTTIEEGIEYACDSTLSSSNQVLNDCIEGLFLLSDLLSDEETICENLQKLIGNIQHILPMGWKDKLLNLKELKKLVLNIKDNVQEDIKVEIEVAFMPYKISMWDSLESIYKEVEQDQDCNCYVVPLPYYEKNEKGEVTRICYEGNQFPEDIKITHYNEYDFENRKPDIIYIHNPYDEYNKLTMVNPRFFSKNLTKYTDMLVYVPYFVAGSSATQYLNILPSYINVSKIVTQSNIAQNTFIANGIDEKKILNLGSPKFDATLAAVQEVKNEIKNNFKINDKRNTILFNTGIADLLATETWVEEIEQVIYYFINHPQFGLIWRPHPLTRVTLNTMRSNILEKFDAIEEKVKRTSNIIIDRTSDVYPAIAVSDGLISDYSSVMLQYIITGKPVLGLLKEQMLEDDRYYFANYQGCYFMENCTVSQFVEMIDNNIDPKKNERMMKFINSINNTDGTCGQKIHFNIKREIIHNLTS